MALLKRIGWYLVGVTMGTVLVVFFFGDRDIQCSYFPNDRVLADLRKKELQFSESILCKNDCMKADSAFYAGVLNNAKVDFSYNHRGTNGSCNTYKLDYTLSEETHVFYIQNCDSIATVKGWELPEGKDCNCPD